MSSVARTGPRAWSVTVKLLVAFAAVVFVITAVSAGTTAYLVDRHGEAEVQALLSQEVIRLQDELQRTEEQLLSVALGSAGDEKNLSDLAILFSQQDALGRTRDVIRQRALELQRTVSMNRLQLILTSARLSSLAVYVDGAVSHWVARGDSRPGADAVIRLDRAGNEASATWLRALVPARMPQHDRIAVRFDFPAPGLMVIRAIMPVQAATRVAFDETVAESPAVVTREAPAVPSERSGLTLIGQYVFSLAFDEGYLDASGVSVTRSIVSAGPPGRLDRLALDIPVDMSHGRGESAIRFAAPSGVTPYYHALKRWDRADGSALILGAAIPRDVVRAPVRSALAGVMTSAVVALAVGIVFGYVLVSRMVSPIRALTSAARDLQRDVGGATAAPAHSRRLHAALGRYVERPVLPATRDEIGELAIAFNAMATRLHEVAGELASSEAQLAEAERLSLTGSFTWNVTADTAVWSAETYRIFGFDPTAPLPSLSAVFDRVHPDDIRRVRQQVDAAAAAGADWSLDHRLLLPDGTVKHVHVAARAERHAGRELEYVGAVMDVSAHRRAEDVLEELAGRLIHAQEVERRRIGRELHDHISQRLGLLTIKLDQQRLSADSEALRTIFDEFRREASDITQDIHDLSHRLHSAMLEQLGLEPALDRLIAEFADTHRLDIDLAVTLSRPVPADIALCLFRVVQEALANVAEHSGAESARILVSDDARGVLVVVEDRGVGFSREGEPTAAGLGLVSMRERLRLVHGTLAISSVPGAGTRIEAFVPLPAPVAQPGPLDGSPRSTVTDSR